MEIFKFEKQGCIPCRKMDMILKSLNVEVKHIDIEREENKDLLSKYSISSVPLLLKVKDDETTRLQGVNHSMTEFKEFLEV